MEQAGRDLVTAAYAGDRDGVCRVTHAFNSMVLDAALVTKTRELLVARGINPQNVMVVVGEQMGSGVFVDLTDGSTNKDHAVRVDGSVVRGDGYTINLPRELYPEAPDDPASPAATITSAP